MKLFELKQQHTEALDKAEAVLNRSTGRDLSADDKRLMDAHMAEANRIEESIKAVESNNTLLTQFRRGGPALLVGGPNGADYGAPRTSNGITHVSGHAEAPQAAQFRGQFAAWMSNALSAIGGGSPAMTATAPTGVVSIGSGTGLDSIALTVPTEVLPYLASYFALDSFGMAGATQFFTDHTRPLVKPVLSAGAAEAVFAENAAPGTSQPFGVSGFTFGGTKYSRLVLATYESLMNSELPLQGAIMDELLSSLATTLTQATTTSFVTALTGAASTLAVGVGGSGGSVYTSMVDLRHAIPPRFDLPTNKWMLSRATLAEIRNTRASTSGVPMFSPDGTKLFDREYVINDYLDATSGAGVGFVTFGSFADGVWLRRTPVQTRVFLELYAQNGQVGFRTTQWADAHFLAELAGAAQPPTFQPIYYTNVVSET
jgi:HK97 family phage major capsid protein